MSGELHFTAAGPLTCLACGCEDDEQRVYAFETTEGDMGTERCDCACHVKAPVTVRVVGELRSADEQRRSYVGGRVEGGVFYATDLQSAHGGNAALDMWVETPNGWRRWEP